MNPEDAYFHCFEEQYEKLTKIKENKKYREILKRNIELQKQLQNTLQEEERAVLEELVASFYYIQMLKNKATFIYAYQLGVKIREE